MYYIHVQWNICKNKYSKHSYVNIKKKTIIQIPNSLFYNAIYSSTSFLLSTNIFALWLYSFRNALPYLFYSFLPYILSDPLNGISIPADIAFSPHGDISVVFFPQTAASPYNLLIHRVTYNSVCNFARVF